MFLAMIALPASPKPSANSAPIFPRVYSNITVSIGASFFFGLAIFYKSF